MKRLILFICLFLLAQNKGTAAQNNPKILSLNYYITACMENNPSIKKIIHASRSEKYSNKTALSIKDVLLELESGYTRKSPLDNQDGKSGEKSNNWEITTSLSKKFPSLLGLTATVSMGYQGSNGYNYSSGKNIDVYGPVIGASFSLPLLKNFLGKLDRMEIRQIGLKNKMVDYLEKESIEELIKKFYLNYFNWILTEKKTKIYREIFKEARELYRQTIRKSRFKIADGADIQLAKQTLIGYQSQLENYELARKQSLYQVYSSMGQKIPGRKEFWQPEAEKESELFPIDSELKITKLRIDKIARLELLQSKIVLGYTNNDLKPELNIILSASKSSEGNQMSNSFNYFGQQELYAGFEFKMPLENSEKANNLQSKRELFKKKTQEYRELNLELSYIDKSTLISKEKIKKILALKKEQVKASKLRLQFSKKKYSQGRIQLRDLIDARSSYAEARIDYIETLISFQKLSLEYAAFRDVLYNLVFLSKNKIKKHLPEQFKKGNF